jgi:membrane fusion protein, multidrug efflux system
METGQNGEGASRGSSVAAPTTVSATGRPSTHRRKLLLGALGAVALVVVCVLGVPWIRLALSTVSTDDAYVNGHVTFVAPRVAGQISRVLVDDNNRVHKGDLLAQIDKEPFEIAVAQKKAAVDTANADLQAAIASTRGIEAEARSRRWKLQSAEENLENQIALLRDRVAALDKSKATLALAQADFERAK